MTQAQTAIVVDATCDACGYDLRGIGSDRCPECGRWYDVTGRLASGLPRRGRGVLGALRSYVKTAWGVSRRPGRLGDELERMVEAGAARRFRWISVGVAWVSIAVALYWVRWLWYVASGGSLGGMNFRNDLHAVVIWERSYWVSVGAGLAALVWGTAVAGWIVYSRRLDDVRANRAAGLARYTSAPLAWTPLVALGTGGIHTLMFRIDAGVYFADWQWVVFVGALPAMELLAWGWCVAVLARRVRGWGRGRAVLTAVALPVVWVGMAGVVLYAAQVVAGVVVLLARSWR